MLIRWLFLSRVRVQIKIVVGNKMVQQMGFNEAQASKHILYEECEETYRLVERFLVYNIPVIFVPPAQRT